MSTQRVKPWLRPRYLEWRKQYEKSEKFLNRVRAYQAKRRSDPKHKPAYAAAQRKYKERNRVRFMIVRAVNRSAKSGVECDKQYLLTLVGLRPTHCPCCGREFIYGGSGVVGVQHPATPSMDRIDSSKGYVEGNVAIICFRCNILKKDGSLSEFEAIAKYMRDRL